MAIRAIWGCPKIRGPLFGSPYNKSPTILGSILWPMIFGISHMEGSMPFFGFTRNIDRSSKDYPHLFTEEKTI